MAKTILVTGSPSLQATVANTTQYWRMFAHFVAATVEAHRNFKFHSPGVLSNLYVRIAANSINGNTVFRTRKNAANGNQSVTIGANATGVFEDTTNTDTLASNDLACYQSVPGAATGTMSLATASTMFAATTNTISKLGCTTPAITATSTTYYFPISGHGSVTLLTAEANAKVRMRKAGTLKNMAVYAGANNTSIACTFRSRKNGANGNMLVSPTVLTTGWFQDTTNTDTIAAGDDINYSLVTSASMGSGFNDMHITAEFESTGGDGVVVCSTTETITFTDASSYYLPLGGRLANDNTENDQKVKARVAHGYSELTAFVSQNSVTSASTIALRQNSVTSALSASITASTTGVFSDSVDTITVATTDDLNYIVTVPSVAGTTTITVRFVNVFTNLVELTRVSKAFIYPSNIQKRVQKAFIYPQNVIRRIQKAFIYPSNVTKRAQSKSLLFDGINDFLELGNHSDLWAQAKTKFSFTIWVYPTAGWDAQGRYIILQSTSTPHGFGLFISSTVTGRALFRIVDAVSGLHDATKDTLVLNAWNHIACVYDNSLGSNNIKIYIGGSVGTGANLTETIDLVSAVNMANGTDDFKGNAKDFRYFVNKALTQTEINDIMANSGAAPLPDYWLPLFEGTGNPVDVVKGKTTNPSGPTWETRSPGQLGTKPVFYPFRVLTRVAKPFIYPANVIKRVQKAFIYPANIQKRVQRAFIYPFRVLKRVTKSFIYPANILKRVQKAFVYPSNIIKRVQKAFVYPFRVLTRVSKAFIYPANILQRIRGVSKSVLLDGDDDHIDLGVQAGLWSQTHNKFAFSIWVKPSTLDINYIVTINDQQIINFIVFAFDGNQFSFEITNDSFASQSAALSDPVTNPDVWYHVLCQYDESLGSDNAQIFLDAVQGDTLTDDVNTPIDLSGVKIFIGALEGNPNSNQFEGNVKDFRFWVNQTLTQPEVEKVKNNDPTAPAPDYWLKMEEGSGDPVDFISGSLTADLVNGATWDNDSPSVWTTIGKAFVYSFNVAARVSKPFVYPANIIKRVQKAFQYPANIQKRVTKAFVYPANVVKRVSKSFVYPSNIQQRISKAFVYPANIVKRIQKAFVFPSNIQQRISRSYIYPANILNRVTKAFGYRFNVIARIQKAFVFPFNIQAPLARIEKAFIYAFNVQKRVTKPFIYPSNVMSRVTKAFIYPSRILQRITKQFVYPSNVQQRISKAFVYPSRILQRISRQYIFPANIMSRIQKAFIYPSNIQQRIQKAFIYSLNIQQRVAKLFVYPSNIVARISRQYIFPANIQARVTKAFQYPFRILRRVAKPFVYPANITVRVAKAFVYPSNIQQRITKAFIFPSNIIARVQKGFIYRFNVVQRISRQYIYPSNITVRVTKPFVYVSNIVARVTKAFIYSANIQAALGRVEKAFVYPFNVQKRISRQFVYPSNIQQRITKLFVYPANIQQRIQKGFVYSQNIVARVSRLFVYPANIIARVSRVYIYPSNIVQRISKPFVYPSNIQQRITKPFIYSANILKRITKSVIYPANIQQRITRAFVYSQNIVARVQKAFVYPLNILARVSRQYIYPSNITVRLTKAFVYRFDIIARIQKALVFPFNIQAPIARVEKAFVYVFNIQKRVTKQFVYPSNVMSRVSKLFQYPSNIMMRVSRAFIYPLNIAQRISKAFIFPSNIQARISRAYIFPSNIQKRISKSFVYSQRILQRVTLQFVYPLNIVARTTKSFVYRFNVVARTSKQFIYPSNITVRVSKLFVFPSNITVRVTKAFGYRFNVVARVRKSFQYLFDVVLAAIAGLDKDPHLLILDIIQNNWPVNSPPTPKKADIVFGEWPNNQGDLLVVTEETPSTTIVDDTLDLQGNVNANITSIKVHVYVKSFNILQQTATYQPQSDPVEIMDVVNYIETFIDKNPRILLSEGVYELEQNGTNWVPRKNWRDDLFHAEINVVMRYVE